MTKQSIINIFGITISVLMIPLIARQFTDEVNWGLGDFLVGGGLIFGFGLLIQLALNKLNGHRYRAYIIIGIVLLFLLIWTELAVGVFGSRWTGS